MVSKPLLEALAMGERLLSLGPPIADQEETFVAPFHETYIAKPASVVSTLMLGCVDGFPYQTCFQAR